MLHNIQYKFKQHVSNKVKNNVKWAPNIRFIFKENTTFRLQLLEVIAKNIIMNSDNDFLRHYI